MTGVVTRDTEQLILRMLPLLGADMAPAYIAGKFSGFTESWFEESFPVSTLNQLTKRLNPDAASPNTTVSRNPIADPQDGNC